MTGSEVRLKIHPTARLKNGSFVASIQIQMFPRFLQSNVLQVEITHSLITEKAVNCLKMPRVITNDCYGTLHGIEIMLVKAYFTEDRVMFWA